MPLTPDAIPTNEQLRESLADRIYHPHKSVILGAGAALFVVIIGFLAFREYRSSRLDDMWSRYHEAEAQFDPTPFGDVDTAAAQKQLESLTSLARDYPDDPVTPYALQQKARAQVAVGDYEGALATLDDIRARFKDFPLNTLPADADAAGKPRSLAQRLAEMIKREKDWAKLRAYVHPLPSEDRLALVETTLGSFWLGFYAEPNQAPLHVEAFVARAKRGDYNGTQVYQVIQSVDGTPDRFECGSRASGLPERGGVLDPAEHDRDEPADTIEPEDPLHTIRHVYRVVSAVKMDSGESATRFVVVAKRTGSTRLDGVCTPFAAVIDREESLKTIETIGRATTYINNPETKDSPGVIRMRDHPHPPIYIRRVSIRSKEKLEEGHLWDTSRIGKDEPEPWEAGRQAPKPEDFEKKPK